MDIHVRDMTQLEHDEDERKFYPLATHWVEPVIVPPWQIDPPSPYAPRWEHEQHARSLAAFWRGEQP